MAHKLLKRLRKGKPIRPKDLAEEIREHATQPTKAAKKAAKELNKWKKP